MDVALAPSSQAHEPPALDNSTEQSGAEAPTPSSTPIDVGVRAYVADLVRRFDWDAIFAIGVMTLCNSFILMTSVFFAGYYMKIDLGLAPADAQLCKHLPQPLCL
jgi:hypothetical protein